MIAVIFLIQFFVVSLPGAHGLQWSYNPQDGAVATVCAGGSLSLPWDITLASGETIVDIQWLFVGRSSELIAVYARGHFLPMAPYSQRVQLVGDAGLSISHVVEGDSGNYSVEVTAHGDSGTVYTLRHTAIVRVYTDVSATTDATVHVVQDTSAVYDSQTHQYHVQLTCTSRGQTPSGVIWTTPSGATISSFSSSYGQFHMLVPNPVTAGNYSCRVAQNTPAVRCLSYNSPVLHGDTVFVDRVEARLTVMEAENNYLKSQVSTLQRAQETEGRHVSFFAKLYTNQHVLSDNRILPWSDVTNQGNAFSTSTGIFTAPYNGFYFFTVVSTSSGTNLKSEINMVRGSSTTISNVHSHASHQDGEVVSLNGLVHLSAGETVWLQSYNGENDYDSMPTYFGGFLINAD